MRFDAFLGRQAEQAPGFRAAWEAEAPLATLAMRVWELRRTRGMTQAELGKRAGLSQPKIAKIERGDANPELRTLCRLAAAMEVAVAELLRDPDRDDARDAAAELHHATVKQYQVETPREFVLSWGRAPAGRGVRRRTHVEEATLSANENFAICA